MDPKTTDTPAPAPSAAEVDVTAVTDAPEKGFLDHARIADPTSEENVARVRPPMDPPMVEDDPSKPKPADTEGGEPAKAPEGGEPTDPLAEPVPGAVPAEPKKLLAGRYEKVEDLEKGYEESSKEGLRLSKVAKTLKVQLAEREAELEAAKADLEAARTAPAFVDLTDEQLAELSAKDPAKALRYVQEKAKRDIEAKQAKKEQEAKRKEQEAERRKVAEYVERRYDELASDSKKYPDFDALKPVMGEIMDKTEDAFAGQPWAPDITYLAALGLRSLRAHQKGLTDKAKSEEAARKKAEADAQVLGARGRAPTRTAAPTRSGGDTTDEDVNEGILKAGGPSVFR